MGFVSWIEKYSFLLFKINEKADDGKILSKKHVKILRNDSANSLYFKLLNVAKHQLKQLSYDIYNKK